MRPVSPLSPEREGGFLAPPKATFRCARACRLAIVLPVCVVLLAVLAIISEALLLAPAMDILNVTNEIAQLFTAFGIAAVAGLTFHFVWESFVSEAFPKIWKVTVRVVAAMLAFGLIVWGILRGYQVAFAASLNQNPLGDFLSGHPILSSIFFVFITLATPVIAATASCGRLCLYNKKINLSVSSPARPLV